MNGDPINTLPNEFESFNYPQIPSVPTPQDIAKSRGDEKKKDHGKLMWDLLPLKQIKWIVAVLTFGAKKYGPNSWQTVDDAENRYFAALMRHLEAHQSGEYLDPESSLPHLAHAACNVVFLLFFKDQKHAKTE